MQKKKSERNSALLRLTPINIAHEHSDEGQDTF